MIITFAKKIDVKWGSEQWYETFSTCSLEEARHHLHDYLWEEMLFDNFCDGEWEYHYEHEGFMVQLSFKLPEGGCILYNQMSPCDLMLEDLDEVSLCVMHEDWETTFVVFEVGCDLEESEDGEEDED